MPQSWLGKYILFEKHSFICFDKNEIPLVLLII